MSFEGTLITKIDAGDIEGNILRIIAKKQELNNVYMFNSMDVV